MPHHSPHPPLRLLPVACGLGAPAFAAEACAHSAQALLDAGLVPALVACGREVQIAPFLVPPRAEHPHALAALCRDLDDQVAAALADDTQPLVIGGDHSIAAGTWRGASRQRSEPLGLLWLDAHMDAHTPQDSPSGNWHGMPLASLLGAGDPMLTTLPGTGPSPHHTALLGVRSYEDSELLQLFDKHVRIFGMAEIRRKGLCTAMREALGRVRQHTAAWGLSLDLDVLDPGQTTGVSTPAANGLAFDDLATALQGLGQDPRLGVVELVEYNPSRDPTGQTARQAIALLAALYGQAAGAK